MKRQNIRTFVYGFPASIVLHNVLSLKSAHCKTWRDRPETYWLARLVQECGGLSISTVYCGWRDRSVDFALETIASIALNWLEMRQMDKTPEEKRLRRFLPLLKVGSHPTLWQRIKRWWAK